MMNTTTTTTERGGVEDAWSLLNATNSTLPTTLNHTDHAEQFGGVETIILPVIFALIFIVGCVGNCLVIVVVVKNKEVFRNTTNLFILNLAVADLLFVVFCVPFHAFVYTVAKWPFGEFMCKLVNFVQYSSMLASIFTLVAMSVDRFLAVSYPLHTKHIRTPHVALATSLSLWLGAVSMAAPWLSFYTVRDYPQHQVRACADDWGSARRHKSTYFLVLFLLGYGLPFLVILVVSSLLIRQLWLYSGTEGPGHRASVIAKRRVTRVVVVVVLVFFVCWLPSHVMWLSVNYFPDFWRRDYTLYYLRITAHVFSYANSALNPLIYAFLSTQFRKGFHRALRCQATRRWLVGGLQNGRSGGERVSGQSKSGQWCMRPTSCGGQGEQTTTMMMTTTALNTTAF